MSLISDGTGIYLGSTTVTANRLSRVRSIDFPQTGNEVDITDLADTHQIAEVGMPKLELTIELLGGTTLTIGTTSNINILWNDGTTTTISNCELRDITTAGSVGSEITTTLVFIEGDST